jgi:tetratricopeptide (TPR) repeat protein
LEELEKAIKTQTVEKWIAFENHASSEVLSSLESRPEFLYARAMAHEKISQNHKALSLYEKYILSTPETPLQNEALARLSLLYARENKFPQGEEKLLHLVQSDIRKKEGLTPRSVEALRQLVLRPYQNKQALVLILDEMEAGRYVEQDVEALLEMMAMVPDSYSKEKLLKRALSFPITKPKDLVLVETTGMKYGRAFEESGRFALAGETYEKVSQLADSKRRAEAAYLGGVAYARAGFLDKATQLWQQAASNVEDGTFSKLASERLSRLR